MNSSQVDVAERSTVPKTYTVKSTVAPLAVAIYCVDPRFHAATEEFLEQELGLAKHEYIPLEIPGGAGPLNLLELPKEAKVVRDQIAFGIEHFPSVQRLIFIAHEDCGKYKVLQETLPHLLSSVKNVTQRQHFDLFRGAELLRMFLPRQVNVEKWYAKFANTDRTQVTFQKL